MGRQPRTRLWKPATRPVCTANVQRHLGAQTLDFKRLTKRTKHFRRPGQTASGSRAGESAQNPAPPGAELGSRLFIPVFTELLSGCHDNWVNRIRGGVQRRVFCGEKDVRSWKASLRKGSRAGEAAPSQVVGVTCSEVTEAASPPAAVTKAGTVGGSVERTRETTTAAATLTGRRGSPRGDSWGPRFVRHRHTGSCAVTLHSQGATFAPDTFAGSVT